MFNLVILSAAAQSRRKNCYLFRYNSDYSNLHCHWNEYKNHFVYKKEILDKTESDDEWKYAYTGRGGIPDDRYNPFTPDASVSSDQEGSEQKILLMMLKAVKVMRKCKLIILLLQLSHPKSPVVLPMICAVLDSGKRISMHRKIVIN